MATLSNQAAVAKRIKAFCKSLNVKCSARSDSFSMGDSVHYSVENIDPITFQKIEEFADEHQYGHFNGMEDLYEYSNSRKDIPQSKYVSGRNHYSDEYYQMAWELLKNSASNGDNKPLNYEDAKNLQWCSDEGFNYNDQISQYVYKILKGSNNAHDYINDLSIKFWQQVNKPSPAPEAKQSNSGVHIEEHMHTKHNFKMFIVVLSDRVTTEEFNELRNAAITLNGWYSRAWGKTPGGFAFKELSNAELFIHTQLKNDCETQSETETIEAPKVNKNLSDKLTEIANNMQKSIDEKMRDRETHTAKKLAQSIHARLEGEQLKRTQQAIYKLAEMHQAGSVPAILQKFTTKTAVYDLMRTKKVLTPNGWHQYYSCTGEPQDTSAEAAALWSLISAKTEAEILQDEINHKTNLLKFSNIPGYFPTPKNIVNLMIEKANILESDRVLDPSAGHGAICDQVKPICKEVKAIEINYTLAEILDAKDYLIEKPRDFLTIEPQELTSYEKILMNPPFENLQDIDHVMHAFKFLKNGGRLVAIMSPSGFFRSDKKAANFRAWLQNLGGECIDIAAGAFKESQTNIATKLIVINKYN
jgi:hypothetical protein